MEKEIKIEFENGSIIHLPGILNPDMRAIGKNPPSDFWDELVKDKVFTHEKERIIHFENLQKNENKKYGGVFKMIEEDVCKITTCPICTDFEALEYMKKLGESFKKYQLSIQLPK